MCVEVLKSVFQGRGYLGIFGKRPGFVYRLFFKDVDFLKNFFQGHTFFKDFPSRAWIYKGIFFQGCGVFED